MLESHYPVSLVCEALALSRSSYYYAASSSNDDQLRLAIAELAAVWPTYGSRRLTAQLRREPHHLIVNRKRVQRLMREMNLVGRRKRAGQATTDSRHSYPRYPNLVAGLEVSYPDEVWVSDITYVRLRQEFIYLAVIMDVFTRIIRGWCLSRSLAVELTLAALEQALVKAVPRIHHSDQGVQYAATEYTERLVEAGVLISMAEVGHAEQNGYCERVIRTIKEEEVYLSEYRDFEEAREQIGRFIDDVYLNKRIHSSLGYLTPAEFEQQWRQNQSRAIAFTLGKG
jgi:transposase InsO family protein